MLLTEEPTEDPTDAHYVAVDCCFGLHFQVLTLKIQLMLLTVKEVGLLWKALKIAEEEQVGSLWG
jgi:hypothetical protein